MKVSYNAECYLTGSTARFLVCQPGNCDILATVFLEKGYLSIPVTPPFFLIGERYFLWVHGVNTIPGNVLISSSFLVAGSCKKDGYDEKNKKYLEY